LQGGNVVIGFAVEAGTSIDERQFSILETAIDFQALCSVRSRLRYIFGSLTMGFELFEQRILNFGCPSKAI
jgi:hypothetical protein